MTRVNSEAAVRRVESVPNRIFEKTLWQVIHFLNTLHRLRQIAMRDLRLIPGRGQVFPHAFRHHHRAMMASGATEAYRQVTLPFPDIMRYQPRQQLRYLPDEFTGLRE